MKAGFVSTVGVCISQFKNLVVRYYQCRVGNGMVKKTLNKVLIAPVNLFFDVTPVGKILKIFNEEVHIFRGNLWWPLIHIIGMISHVVVVLTTMFSIGGWETCIALCLMVFMMSFVIPPFMSADNQLHRVSSSLWGPIHSYFYECMRGTSVIRAFGQEESIMKKQHELLDKTTSHFIAHHSCRCWYNLRLFYCSKLFYILAIFLIAKTRTTAETISLVLLFRWTTDMHWIMHMLGCLNWFMREA